jgi:hypothetical protein
MAKIITTNQFFGLAVRQEILLGLGIRLMGPAGGPVSEEVELRHELECLVGGKLHDGIPLRPREDPDKQIEIFSPPPCSQGAAVRQQIDEGENVGGYVFSLERLVDTALYQARQADAFKLVDLIVPKTRIVCLVD